jgi:hypothetical protein
MQKSLKYEGRGTDDLATPSETLGPGSKEMGATSAEGKWAAMQIGQSGENALPGCDF